MTKAPTKRQLKLLDAEDWRHFAIGPVGTGLGMIATTEKHIHKPGPTVNFSLPSAPALYLNLANRARSIRVAIDLENAFVAHPHPQGTWPEDHRQVFDFFQEMAAEIIFSNMALEAFANENIPAEFKYKPKSRKGGHSILKGPKIERQVSLTEKLEFVLPEAHSIASPSGTGAWDQFKSFKKIRDRLVHLKSVERNMSGPEEQTVWGYMINERSLNFPAIAHRLMGMYPDLVKDRRWHQSAVALFA